MRNIRDHRQPETSGYATLFGPSPLACAITQTQAAKISEGSKLEKVLVEQASFVLDLEDPENLSRLCLGTLPALARPYVVSKKHIKNFLWPSLMSSSTPNWEALSPAQKKECIKSRFPHEPDMMLVDAKNRQLTFIELKSFCVFDTEKSQAISEKLKAMPKPYDLPYSKKGQTVCFYATDHLQIVEGMKKRLVSDQVLTGREFLDTISDVPHACIMELTQGSHNDNVAFLLDKALESSKDLSSQDLLALLQKHPHILKLLKTL